MHSILIVEDDENQRELYRLELQEEGYQVDQARNGKEAVEKARKKRYDAVILDIRMPEMDGVEALGKILARNKKTPVIIYSAYSNYKSNFMTWTANAYLTKSTSLDELKSKIKEVIGPVPASAEEHTGVPPMMVEEDGQDAGGTPIGV